MKEFKFSWKVVLILLVASILAVYLAGFSFLGIVFNYGEVPILAWIAIILAVMCFLGPLYYVVNKTFEYTHSATIFLINLIKTIFIFFIFPIILVLVSYIYLLIRDDQSITVLHSFAGVVNLMF